MANYKQKEEKFKKKYGYLIINHPIEYALIEFLVYFGALSLVQDISIKLGLKLFSTSWSGLYKYLFSAGVTSLHLYYWRKIAARNSSTSEQ